MNKYPLWKNLLLLFILLVAIIYAIPNLFMENPAIQISSTTPGLALKDDVLQEVKSALKAADVGYRSAIIENKSILIQFSDTDAQLHAKAILTKTLGNEYIVALSLQRAIPKWLFVLGAKPMKLGLDLRGGVHFLLQVDIDSVIKESEKSDLRSVGEELRSKHVRYVAVAPQRHNGIKIKFRSLNDMQKAQSILSKRFSGYIWKSETEKNRYELKGQLLPTAIQDIRESAIERTMKTLRRRVDELGVSEAIVQRQGKNRISVDLPGIQDAAQAKNILGKTATLEFRLVDVEHDVNNAIRGMVPIGSELFRFEGHPILLKNRILLTGDSIIGANASFDNATGRPAVSIRTGGGREALFARATGENIGKPMAVVYVELNPQKQKIDGKEKIIYKKSSKVVNVATIQSELRGNFQITGLSSPEETRNLALLLRAGALPAPIAPIEERTIGPSMGKQNIQMGMLSVEVGLLLVVVFMILYYRFFGLVADIGLFVNLVFLIALLSIIGATLTFPGIAGIVLTIGMAVDANVLIYERIREELRRGMTPQAAIHAGYERAFVTIVDANISTLLVALILFALGTGAIKGFAITLTIGLLTSMVSAITFTRALVNFTYGGRRIKHLSIGIKVKDK